MMSKTIYGLGNCAKTLGIGLDRVRRLIFIKEIKPKKVKTPFGKVWTFDEHDQKIIRQHASMRG